MILLSYYSSPNYVGKMDDLWRITGAASSHFIEKTNTYYQYRDQWKACYIG